MKHFNFIVNRICANTPPCCSKRASRFVWVFVLMLLTLGVGQMWGDTAPVNTVLWAETWTGATTGTGGNNSYTPSSNCSTSKGTTMWGNATITYTQSANTVYCYTGGNLAGGTAPELLITSSQTWTISGIPTGGATEMALTYKSNNTKSSVTCSTTGVTITGSSKSYTINNATAKASTITLVFNCSGNTRIDDVQLKVTTAGTSGGGGTTYTVTYNKNNGSGTMTDSNSPYSSGATVTTLPNSFTRSNYIFTGWNTQAGGSGTAYAENATFSISGNTTLFAQWVASSLNDHINRGTTGVTSGSTSYSNWSGKTATSSAVYAGNSAGGNNSIQLRTNNSNSGVVTTKSGGKAKYITVTWNASTSSGRKIDIYGKNEAYTAASDLYSNQSATQGTYLGSIAYQKQTVLAISGDYEYIGIRSQDGALYLSDIYIEWEACQSLGQINGSVLRTHF